MAINFEGGYWASNLYSHWPIIFPGFGTACFRTTFGLFELSLYIIYLVIRDSTCTFLTSEKELFVAVVNYVYSVTIAIDISYYY